MPSIRGQKNGAASEAATLRHASIVEQHGFRREVVFTTPDKNRLPLKLNVD